MRTLIDIARAEFNKNAGLSVDHLRKAMRETLYSSGPIELYDEFAQMDLQSLRKLAFDAFNTRHLAV